MTTTAIPSPSFEEVVPRWLEELQASDRARGTIRRSTCAGEGFLAYYADEEQRSLIFSTSAHTLRHTSARNYVAEHPGDSVGLARLLGHTSLDTTRSSRQPTIKHLSTRGKQLPQNASGEVVLSQDYPGSFSWRARPKPEKMVRRSLT